MFDPRAIQADPVRFTKGWARRFVEAGTTAEKPHSEEPERHARTIVELVCQHVEKIRESVTRRQGLETERNRTSKAVGAALAAGDNSGADRLKARVVEARQAIALAETEEREARLQLDEQLARLPNLPMDDVPDGMDERGNVEQKKWGKVRNFPFQPRDHADLGVALGLMDFKTAAKLSGARFVLLTGALARLERALAAFMLDRHTRENGYTEISPPLLVRAAALHGTGQLPKFSCDLFAVGNRGMEPQKIDAMIDKDHGSRAGSIVVPGKFPEGFLTHHLVPTAEVPLTNIVADTIVAADTLPRRYVAHTPCFRSEAGSAGRDTRGMIRLHQFNKVELVSIVRDETEGLAELERMTRCAESILEDLGLPWRRMLLCAGDMGFQARKTYDLEVWLPSQNTWREISSCSYCGDFQARRMQARWRSPGRSKPDFVHTLNGSGLAVGRTLVAILENYQQEDGSITVPEVLRDYMDQCKRIDILEDKADS